jgi:hypothetical protein
MFPIISEDEAEIIIGALATCEGEGLWGYTDMAKVLGPDKAMEIENNLINKIKKYYPNAGSKYKGKTNG